MRSFLLFAVVPFLEVVFIFEVKACCMIYDASVKDGPRSLLLKFGQNQVNNSWDIPDMEWTNVARTNVAWTNVTVTVGIC